MYPNRRSLERRWAAGLLAVLLAPLAWAHDADIIYVLLANAPGGELEESVTLTAGTLSQLAPVDADRDGALSQADLDARADAIRAGVWDQMPLEGDQRCTRGGERAQLRDGFVELTARFGCGTGALSQDFRILRGLTTNYRVVLGRALDGESGRAFAQGNVQRLWIRPIPSGRPAERDGLGFVGGLGSPLSSPAVTLLWLLSVLLAPSLGSALTRSATLVGVNAAGCACLAALGLSPPPIAGAAAVAAVGGALAFGVLALGPQRFPRWGVGVLALASATGIESAPQFQLGRLCAVALLTVVAVPIARRISRHPERRRAATLTLCCLALASVGFSLIHSARAF